MAPTTPDDDLSWLTSTLAADGADGRGVLPEWVRLVQPGQRVVGPAVAIASPVDDNLAVRHLVAGDRLDGKVVVVGGLATASAACLGEILAQGLRRQGCIGFVTDGLVRDIAVLRGLADFPIWCRGMTPRASRKEGPFWPGSAVCAGVPVSDGDLVVADDDGVVVWPRERIAALRERAWAKMQQDQARLERILAGGALDDPPA